MEPKFIAEQEIVLWRSAQDHTRVTIRIGEPALKKDGDGDYWVCHLRLDGLIELGNQDKRGGGGASSFHALVKAICHARLLLREELNGARIFMVDRRMGKEELFPEDGVTVDELFEIDAG